jgi:hypothetical protein
LVIFLRASLHCVPESQPRAIWEQLRASLRRKELSFFAVLRPDFAAIASLRAAQAKRSSRALTLDSWTEAREE